MARAFLRDQRGAVAVEFAAIALPLILLLTGSIEISRYMWTRHALQDAASTGARCLGLRLAPCFEGERMDREGAIAFVREQAADWRVRMSGDAITPEAAAECPGGADFSRVGIRNRFSAVAPGIPDMWIEVEACFPNMPSA